MSFSPLISKALRPAGLAAPGKRRAEFFARVGRLCPVCALQARLMDAFGLAVHEVVDLEPAKSDAGDRLVLARCAGGRVVAIETREQRELLDAAKAAVDDQGLLRPVAGRNSRQTCRRLRFLIAAAAKRRHEEPHEARAAGHEGRRRFHSPRMRLRAAC